MWGLVGGLRGSEPAEEYQLHEGLPVGTGRTATMSPGEVDAVSSTLGDWHRVTNTSDDVAISIHVYGGNVGAVHRNKLDETSGRLIDFVSGQTCGGIRARRSAELQNHCDGASPASADSAKSRSSRISMRLLHKSKG